MTAHTHSLDLMQGTNGPGAGHGVGRGTPADDPDLLGTLERADCHEWLPTLPSAAYAAMVVCPPQLGVHPYELRQEAFTNLMLPVLTQAARVLVQGGTMILSVNTPAPKGDRWTVVDDLIRMCRKDLGFRLSGIISWDRGNSQNFCDDSRRSLTTKNTPIYLLSKGEARRLIVSRIPEERKERRGSDIWCAGLDHTLKTAGGNVVRGAMARNVLADLFRILTEHGETILDPMAGSGTTGVAALDAHRKFATCEIDPQRFALGCRRVGAHSNFVPDFWAAEGFARIYRDPDTALWALDERFREAEESFGCDPDPAVTFVYDARRSTALPSPEVRAEALRLFAMDWGDEAGRMVDQAGFA